MNAGVVREFGMEGGGHGLTLANKNRIVTFTRQDFNTRCRLSRSSAHG